MGAGGRTSPSRHVLAQARRDPGFERRLVD